tara:strand:- start:214 stop:369 length:156 start_codon:yes stop_codon:yes gene_type:complete
MLDIDPNRIVAEVLPLEIEIPFLIPMAMAFGLSFIILLGYYDIQALRSYHD